MRYRNEVMFACCTGASLMVAPGCQSASDHAATRYVVAAVAGGGGTAGGPTRGAGGPQGVRLIPLSDTASPAGPPAANQIIGHDLPLAAGPGPTVGAGPPPVDPT